MTDPLEVTDPNVTDPNVAGPNVTDPANAGGAGADGSNPDGTNPDVNVTDPDGMNPNVTDPDGMNPGGTNGTDGNNTVAPIPTSAPSMLGSAPNTDNMVFFTLEYGFRDKARDPTEEEIVDLICRTNLFFRDRLRNETGEDTVQSEALYVDWSYSDLEDIKQPVMINFTANATYEDTGDDVPIDVVFNNMQVSVDEIVQYIQEYVWTVQPENVFAETVSVNFTTQPNVEVPVGRLTTVVCPTTPAPTGMPTVSPAPSVSKSPSSMPSFSSAPSTSPAPSSAPSVVPPPTEPPASGPTSGGGDVPTEPTISPGPTSSSAPTNTPTVSAAPTFSPAPSADLGPVARQVIQSKFVVSNIDGLGRSDQVNASGLSASWPVFADEVVRNITRDNDKSRRSLRYGGRGGRRLVVVGVEPGTASVDNITRTSCGEEGVFHVDSACHDVEATYTLLMRGEDPALIEREYTDATVIAINDGTYQYVMETVDPETPLMIGIIPPPDDNKSGDDDGMAGWLLALIILLCILCCLCTLAALFFLINKNNQSDDKELEPYDEEGFAYDFLIPPNQKPQTEVDDEDATRDVEDDGEEQFEDEDGGLAKNIGDADDDDVVVVMSEEVDESEEGEEDDADNEEEEDNEVEIRAIAADPGDEEADLVDVDDEKEAPPDSSEEAEEEPPVPEENWDDEPPTDSEAHKEEPAEAEGDWESDEGDKAEAEAGEEEEWDDENKHDDDEGFEEGDDDDEDGWDDEDDK